MVSAIVIIGKINQDTYVVKAEDWLNPDVPGIHIVITDATIGKVKIKGDRRRIIVS